MLLLGVIIVISVIYRIHNMFSEKRYQYISIENSCKKNSNLNLVLLETRLYLYEYLSILTKTFTLCFVFNA